MKKIPEKKDIHVQMVIKQHKRLLKPTSKRDAIKLGKKLTHNLLARKFPIFEILEEISFPISLVSFSQIDIYTKDLK